MRAFIVYDHPYPESFAAAALRAVVSGLAAAGHEADVADLHADRFDPVYPAEALARYAEGAPADASVLDYQRRIDAAHHLVFVFPVWWQVLPAMSKGFLDKVLLPGWAFELREGTPVGLLGRLRVTFVTSMGATASEYTSEFGNALVGMFTRGTWGFVGIPEQQVTWLNFADIDRSTLVARREWLNGVEEYFRSLTHN
jgi:putative NADPH-quinone reductase